MTPAAQPDISVIIPTRDRFELLRRCLGSLSGQTCDMAGVEVIVADDGSTDGTAEIVERMQARFRLRVLRLGQHGKSSALNSAIDAAAGAVCIFLDDDVVATTELVGQHLAAHRRDNRCLGIGALIQRPPNARDWYAHTFARTWNEHYDELDRRPARWTDCYGANFSAPLAALRMVGGFAADLTTAEDLEVGLRLYRAGCAPTYLPKARAEHDDQKRRHRMLVDSARQGRAHVELAERHADVAEVLLDWPAAIDRRELALRRAFLSLRIPLKPLAALGALLPGVGRKVVWFHIVSKVAFWRGAQRSMSRELWTEITRRDRVAPARNAQGKGAR